MVRRARRERYTGAASARPPHSAARAGCCGGVWLASGVVLGSHLAGAVPGIWRRDWRGRREAGNLARRLLRSCRRAGRHHRRRGRSRRRDSACRLVHWPPVASSWAVDAVRGVDGGCVLGHVFGGLRGRAGMAYARISPCFVGQRPVNRTAKPSSQWWKTPRQVFLCGRKRLRTS